MDEEIRMMELMADIDAALSRHNATTLEVMVAGEKLIVSAYRQVVRDNPQCNAHQLAESICQKVLQRLMDGTGTTVMMES